jgi:hypothetical protein
LIIEQWIPIPDTRPSRKKDVQREPLADRYGESTIINLETLEVLPNSPVMLEFKRVVGRPHKPPLEEEFIVFSEQDPKDLAEAVKEDNDNDIAMKLRVKNALLAKTSEATGQDPSSSGTKRKCESDNSETKKKRNKDGILLSSQSEILE